MALAVTRFARGFDAIVCLDGDRPRRLRRAVELAAAGVAPTLVVVRAEAVAPELLAARSLPFEILSVLPDPSTTRGERGRSPDSPVSAPGKDS